MEEMRAQAERFGAEILTRDVVEADLTGSVKSVTDPSTLRRFSWTCFR
jgi:thioredoxin reductase (NADPH)